MDPLATETGSLVRPFTSFQLVPHLWLLSDDGGRPRNGRLPG
jgi:hypothetical protein